MESRPASLHSAFRFCDLIIAPASAVNNKMRVSKTFFGVNGNFILFAIGDDIRYIAQIRQGSAFLFPFALSLPSLPRAPLNSHMSEIKSVPQLLRNRRIFLPGIAAGSFLSSEDEIPESAHF